MAEIYELAERVSVLRDGNLVTGQNPASATRTAELVMEALKDKVA